MNRIVLVGNGFDLAHGLKTSYADFVKWYWRDCGKRLLHGIGGIIDDGICVFKLNDNVGLVNWYDVWRYFYVKSAQLGPWDELEVVEIAKGDRKLCDFPIKNSLFQKICNEVETKNWVDIEDVYYSFLKSEEDPKQVNDDLGFVTDKLIEYLNSLEKPSINPVIQKQILAPISRKEIAIESMTQWEGMVKDRFMYDDIEWKNLIDGYYSDYESIRSAESSIGYLKSVLKSDELFGTLNYDIEKICPTFRLPDKIMLLDFNYTNTTDLYLPKADKFTVNHIHGTLSNPKSVIFGYGDELDNSFKELLDNNNNEYLRNIKSIKYLEVPNYRNMLRFIESSPYQIYIMGHSCGNSDRTMLNTLFEHKNCVSIKPFYHKWDDGTDNYMEIVQNIARNFTDMKLMRDRVVNKTFCETI